MHSGNKYLRDIITKDGLVDVYAVLVAFDVKCPARQHAIKKLLCAGIRGKGDSLQDLKEAADAVSRAIELAEAQKPSEDVIQLQCTRCLKYWKPGTIHNCESVEQ